MRAKLVSFRIGKMNATKRRNFQRELYGYKDFSNKGKYVYKREGMVQKTKSRKMDSVILTSQANAPRVIKILKKYGAKVQIFDLVIERGVL